MKAISKTKLAVRFCTAFISLVISWYVFLAVTRLASSEWRDGITFFLIFYCAYTTLDGIESMIVKWRTQNGKCRDNSRKVVGGEIRKGNGNGPVPQIQQ